MTEIVAVGALRNADAEMRADAPIDGLHPRVIVFVDRKSAHDQETRPGLDPLQHESEIAVERRVREMLPPDLMKFQPHLLDARHPLVDRGEMGGREVPIERVAVEITPEPAVTVADRMLGQSIGHWRFSLLGGVYKPAEPSATPRIASLHGRMTRLLYFRAILIVGGATSP